MWEIFNPMILKYGVAFVVELVVVMALYLQYLPEILGDAYTTERAAEISFEITNTVYQYITEVSALAALVTIPFLGIMINNDRRREKKTGFISNKKAPLAQYFYVGVIGTALSLGLNNILILSNLAEYSEAYQEASEILYSPSFPVQIVCVGIIIPIMEEMVFRGLIYRRMRHNVSMIKAMIFSSLIFGFYHGNMVQFIYALFAGLLLSYLYEKYGSLKAPVFAHMLMNVVSLILTEEEVFTWIFSDMMRMAVITIACAAIGSTMFVLINRIDEKPDTEKEETKPQEAGPEA